MRKQELIKALAKKAGITNLQAKKFLNAFADSVISALQKGKKVTITGFGSFSLQQRSARIGVDPTNPKKRMKIPAVKVAKFRTGLRLRKAVK